MNDKYRKSLDAKHSMRLALSDVEPPFQNLLKRNGDKYNVMKVLLLVLCSFRIRVII